MSMTRWDEFTRLMSLNDADSALLRRLRELSRDKEILPGQVIMQQYHPADYVYFLLEGRVQLLVRQESRAGEFEAGVVAQALFPLGWSGFAAPHRYATTARADTPCRLIVWPREALEQVLHEVPDIGVRFYVLILEKALHLLNQTKCQVRYFPKHVEVQNAVALGGGREGAAFTTDINQVLAQSLFFEVFPPQCLMSLGKAATLRCFHQGEVICRENEGTDQGLFILAKGEVSAGFERDDQALFLRAYNTPGQLLSHPLLAFQSTFSETLTAQEDVTLLHISTADLDEIGKTYPDFSLQFTKRMLWLVGARLKTVRAQFIAQRYDHESTAVEHLLQQYSPQLKIDSLLYKIPPLLENRITYVEAFAYLDRLKEEGSNLERIIAGVCLDMLNGLRRETNFYQGLSDVYQTVAHAPVDMDAEQVRRRCSEQFRAAFEKTRYVIEGQEHLPEKPGHIYILNHLISHPHHKLPNGFELALDTHFVSAMILAPKYGDGGVRIVRKGRGDEFGHHQYYDRLSHIYVYTAESDPVDVDTVYQRREQFYQLACDYIKQGKNLVICPEGTSRWSETSPDVFKAGAFRLAAMIDPEPLIVPIAVANFDKRLKDNVLAAVIQPPFRITDVTDPSDKAALNAFLADYRNTYRSYVQHAVGIAKRASTNNCSGPRNVDADTQVLLQAQRLG